MRVPELIDAALTGAEFEEFGNALTAMQTLVRGQYATLALSYGKPYWAPRWGAGVHSCAYGGHLYISLGHESAEAWIDQYGLHVHCIGATRKRKIFSYGYVDL